jgi:hypothetical protein
MLNFPNKFTKNGVTFLSGPSSKVIHIFFCSVFFFHTNDGYKYLAIDGVLTNNPNYCKA